MAKQTKQEEKDFQKFLDENQYAFNKILQYEKLFGRGFVSTGGGRNYRGNVRLYIHLGLFTVEVW